LQKVAAADVAAVDRGVHAHARIGILFPPGAFLVVPAAA